jgi:hypothetical protein
MLERYRAGVKPGSGMIGRIVTAPVLVEAHGLARGLVVWEWLVPSVSGMGRTGKS